MEQITFEQLIGAVAVILLLCGAYSTVMTAVKARREDLKVKAAPIDAINEKLEEHAKCLRSDKVRIEALEQSIGDFREYNGKQDSCLNILVRSQLSMLRHMQHGNNVDGMRESEKEITDYLTGK